ncbi:hypothetical protein GW765_04825 [Candidatus Parcubacteria bacterium]|nr:hypothetical protein [Candidatus Parcubacteria bacterium]
MAIKKSLSMVASNFSISQLLEKQKLFFGQSKFLKSQGISNLRLVAREARGNPQNQWAALCAAYEKVGQISESQILVQLFNSARTYFIKDF